jgi:hypothetical protein
MAKAFISYSHKNEGALARLHTHLAMLRREKLISDWYDREILAGKNIDREVQSNLEDSQLFIALVSPDFLASNYCYEKEMTAALERHEGGSLQVIPVIVEACDWKSSPLAKLKALPKDGKPISTWTNEDVAYLDVVTELRRLLSANDLPDDTRKQDAHVSRRPPRRYRVQREFDAIDRADFARAAFVAIRDYFEHSIDELNQIGDAIRARFERMSDIAFTCTILNKGVRNGEAHITVRLSEGRSFGDINYVYARRATDNTSNGYISVESTEYDLYLELDSFDSQSEDGRLTSEQAADAIWRRFIAQAGIRND